MKNQMIRLGDINSSNYIEFSIRSGKVLSKLIETVSLCLVQKLLIKQEYGYVIVTNMSSDSDKALGKRAFEFKRYSTSMTCVDDSPIFTYTYIGGAGDFINNVLSCIDMCNVSMIEDYYCNMSWIDETGGLHMMVRDDRSIIITNDGDIYYETCISSKCIVDNVKYKEFNCYAVPDYDGEYGYCEYLISYNMENPILSTYCIAKTCCKQVDLGDQKFCYFIDENGKAVMAYSKYKSAMAPDAFTRITKFDPDGETLYMAGNKSDYDMHGRLIILYHNPNGESHVKYACMGDPSENHEC